MPTKTDVTEIEVVPPSLASKLSAIMGQLGTIEKKGENKSQHYAFVRESDVVAALVPMLAEKHIFIHQTVISSRREALYQTQSNMTMWISEVIMEFYFIDGDTGEETKPRQFNGAGADTGDKGIYKAMTGAEKYFLMKSFLISTGDDPEADERVDKQAAAAGAAGGTRVTRSNVSGAQRGGKSEQATTAQISEIARLAKELGLDADGIVPVISKVIGTEPAEGQTVRQWLAGMKNAQAAEIIGALSAGADAGIDKTTLPVESSVDGVDKPAETADSVDPPDLAIV